MVRIGDKCRFAPEGFISSGDKNSHTKTYVTGTVIYIHPQGRFFVVEHHGEKGSFREAIQMGGNSC